MANIGNYDDANAIHTNVKNYYGRVIQKASDLKTPPCCSKGTPPLFIKEALTKIPPEIIARSYGCGSPLPAGIEGLRILDLGCGSGRDCYIAAAMTGPDGFVTGIDMTPEQLDVARKYSDDYCTKALGYPKPNMRFVEGYAEGLEKAGIEPGSVDIVISNCVINLSANKHQVLREVFKSLRNGGELYFSDMYSNRRLPAEIRDHEVAQCECLGGNLYVEDFKRICKEIGFTDVRQVSSAPIAVPDPELAALIGETRYFSITFRCFKLSNLESLGEDYGQLAVYNGKIKEEPNAYQFDGRYRFERGRPVRVCGNTASMLGESWLSKYFQVMGGRDVHYGRFDCGAGAPSSQKIGSSCC